MKIERRFTTITKDSVTMYESIKYVLYLITITRETFVKKGPRVSIGIFESTIGIKLQNLVTKIFSLLSRSIESIKQNLKNVTEIKKKVVSDFKPS